MSSVPAPARVAVLSGEQVGEVARWEQPAMDAGGRLLTARQLESLQQQAFEEALAARLPFSLLATPREVLDLEQLLARGYWEELEVDGQAVRLPGAPFQAYVAPAGGSK